ncbi:hypothetical protein [Chondromyces crocatus]|uniref:Uncharacterized protein n=1 Tax=Chondromyces crocatus TaxID=52 RepID=A0A0K1EPM6_CHOCO|nr:hypothetical protein [Chondromyces crocatus]AKT42774.1 uncharacterized protein CMC5_070010 [Chondromyces crocatus]
MTKLGIIAACMLSLPLFVPACSDTEAPGTPIDETPIDEPPIDEPPVAEPPIDEPPVDEPPATMPPDADAFGQSMSAWGAAWWTWAFGVPEDENPLFGHDCDTHQSGPVFFLTGNMGSGAETRSCTVPADKALFFPLLNATCASYVQDDLCCNANDEELEACVNGFFDPALTIDLVAELDGVPLPNLDAHMTDAQPFSWTGPEDPATAFHPYALPTGPNECGFPEDARNGMTKGYYLMLAPLSPGEHTLRFGGKMTFPEDRVFEVDITYQLTQK